MTHSVWLVEALRFACLRFYTLQNNIMNMTLFGYKVFL
jgi:hypothetical protein